MSEYISGYYIGDEIGSTLIKGISPLNAFDCGVFEEDGVKKQLLFVVWKKGAYPAPEGTGPDGTEIGSTTEAIDSLPVDISDRHLGDRIDDIVRIKPETHTESTIVIEAGQEYDGEILAEDLVIVTKNTRTNSLEPRHFSYSRSLIAYAQHVEATRMPKNINMAERNGMVYTSEAATAREYLVADPTTGGGWTITGDAELEAE